jgi:hypothetical protein
VQKRKEEMRTNKLGSVVGLDIRGARFARRRTCVLRLRFGGVSVNDLVQFWVCENGNVCV